VGAVSSVILLLHGLVTYGPSDLDIASAMSAQGYDAVKWAEGQGVLAELVSSEAPADTTLAAATNWYVEAADAARQALSTKPQLLAKLGIA
jgi:alpha-beta hydrolase superfamily lysophospholipase